MKLRKGDNVKVLIGKDKGKLSTVERVLPSLKKVLVANVNQYKRHVKGRGQGQKSEIVTITKPLPISSVSIICPKCNKPTRVGYSFNKSGKVRICRKCKEVL